MITTRVFKSGNSQAVRIPHEFRLETSEVEIFRRDNELVIRPKRTNLAAAFHLITEMSDDFMQDDRQDSIPQERDFSQ